MTSDERTQSRQTRNTRRTVVHGLARVAVAAGQVGLVLSAVLCGLLYAFQARLIFPGRATQGTPEAEVDPPPPGAELVGLTTVRGDRVVALFGPALSADGRPLPDAARRPTLLSFYGNGMCVRDTVDEDFALFRRLGVNVLIPDYVGFGLSSGAPSESGCYETADAALEHLRARRDVDPESIVVVGRSLGGAVAIDLAARTRVAGLAVFSTFTRMSEMAHRQFPAVPVTLLLRHRFDSLSKIGRVRCPILIGHGHDDRLVPRSMAARLAAAARAPVTSLTIAGADHNDLFAVGGDQVFSAMRTFLAAVSTSANQGTK